MSVNTQRLPAAGIEQVAIEVERGRLTVAWRDSNEIVIDGDGLVAHQEGEAAFQVDREGVATAQPAGDLLITARGDHRTRASLILPLSLPACVIAMRHGDLTLDQPAGRVEARLDRGNFAARGGQAVLTVSLGSGDGVVDALRGPLTLHTGSGDVNLSAIDGPVEVRTGSGDIRVHAGAGDLTLRSGSGNVTVTARDSGSVTVSTGSGDVTLTDGRARHMSVNSGSGDLRSTVLLGLGTYQFTTSSGDLHIGIPPGLAARIEAVTGQGSLRSSVPLVSVGQRGPKSMFGRRLVGSIGEGEQRAEIALRTGRGDVRLDWLPGAGAPGGPAREYGAPPGDLGARIRDEVRRTIKDAMGRAGRELGEEIATAAAGLAIAIDRQVIHHADPTPPTPPTPPTAPSPPSPPASAASLTADRADAPAAPPSPARSPADDQRAVLEALATGAITVAEAERLLAHLDR